MHWLSGEDNLTRWGQSATIDAANTMTNLFCKTCGTILSRESSGYPRMSFPRVGPVEDLSLHDSVLKPQVEQYTKSRAAWFHGVDYLDEAHKAEGMFNFGG
ncbi:hypothetical protein LTR53_016731 [Teratosphaeriaceae sp. CCFEE 6253]|nr:hypothetical protein LTR53_016731 [Teratosphaeriaceae sp. CCFEE 6253]